MSLELWLADLDSWIEFRSAVSVAQNHKKYNVPECIFRVVGRKCASLRRGHATVVKAMRSDSDIVSKSALRRVEDLCEALSVYRHLMDNVIEEHLEDTNHCKPDQVVVHTQVSNTHGNDPGVCS